MEYEQYLFCGLNLLRFKSHIDSFLDKRKDEEKCGSKWNTSRACTKYKIVEVISFFGNKLCLYYEYFETSMITLIQQKHKTLSQIQIRTYINYVTKGSPVAWQSTNGSRLANEWNLVITMSPGMNECIEFRLRSSDSKFSMRSSNSRWGRRGGGSPRGKFSGPQIQIRSSPWEVPNLKTPRGSRAGSWIGGHTHTHAHTHTVNQRTAGEGPAILD